MSDALQPMPPFDWQQQQWDDFCTRAENNVLAHAFLLAGVEGIGAFEMAMAMGQYLLCQSPLPKLACGKCRGCQLLNAGTHPDLLKVLPEEPGKQIKIDQIREISAKVDQTAQQGGKKIVVLCPAESMNINAANALLKNLEEPSGETHFFLVAHALSRVLPTIRSRCAKITMPMPSRAQSIHWLASVGVKNAERILDDVSGAPLLARAWQDNGTADEFQEIREGLVHIAEARLEPMNFAKRFSKTDPLMLIQLMLSCTDVVLAQKIGKRRVSGHHISLIRICKKTRPDVLFRLRDRLCERKAQLLASPNLNAALFVEELALDWTAMLTVRE